MRIISADFVLPIVMEPIERGGVAIDADRIAAVGTIGGLVEKYPDAAVEDFGRAAIVPGFVNCHSHLEITAMRGLLDDVEHDFGSWLLRLNDTRQNKLADADIEVAAVAGAAEGAFAGVTCFGDIGRHGKAGLEALKAVGLRGVVFQETNFSPDDRTAEKDLDELAEKIGALQASETTLVRVGASPHSPYTVGRKLFTLIAEHAGRERLKVSIHAAESRGEQQLMQDGTGFFADLYEKFGAEWTSPRCSSIEYLERTGILQNKPLLAHCVTASDTDLELINSTGSSVAHCPKSNAKFGHGWAPLERMLDIGIDVGLGSDSVASNNMCDIIDEARFAALGARNRDGSSRFIGGREMLAAATLGGAKALGLDAEIGSLEVGKQADIAVVSLAGVAHGPVNDVHSAIVFSSSSRDVVFTMVAGRVVYSSGETRLVDRRELSNELERIRRKIAG